MLQLAQPYAPMLSFPTLPAPVKRGNPAVAIIKSAIAKTRQRDAFEFKDFGGNVIRVERTNTKNYGYHWRIYHGDVTYIISYDTLEERRWAARKVQNYLQQRVVWPTLKLHTDSALDYWQDAPSRVVLL